MKCELCDICCMINSENPLKQKMYEKGKIDINIYKTYG